MRSNNSVKRTAFRGRLPRALDRTMPIPPDLFRQIVEAICRPVGTVTFEYSSPEAFLDNGKSGIILEIPSGGHYFRLDRTEERVLRFYHSSPGTGTRVATIDLAGLPAFEKAFLAFVWSPDEIRFHCGPRGIEVPLLEALGVPSPVSFRLGQDGSVFQIGGEGIQVSGVRVRHEGALVLSPTAIEVWRSTVEAVELLWTGKSDKGFMFEVLQATSSLAMLVTGLENYAKTRLQEIEKEGIAPDSSRLFNAFTSRAIRKSARFQEIEASAVQAGQGIFCAILDSLAINFQDFDNLKRAFRTSYGIRIGEIGTSSTMIVELRQLIKYRHRVVHVSPLLAMLNDDQVPPAEPVFANRALANRAVEVFQDIINHLHKASTSLMRKDAV